MEGLEDLLAPAVALGMGVEEREGAVRVALPCSPVALLLDRDRDRLRALLYCRTRSSDWAGERTDLNDAYSSIAATALAASGSASALFIDVEHPVAQLPGEVYARHLWLEQPSRGSYSAAAAGAAVAALLRALDRAEDAAHATLPCPAEVPPGHPARSSYRAGHPDDAAWADAAAAALDVVRGHDDVVTGRPALGWRYYRSAGTGTAVIGSARAAAAVRRVAGESAAEVLEGPQGGLVINGALRNALPRAAVGRAARALSRLEPTGSAAAPVATEDRIVLAGDEHVLLLPADCGRTAFERERELVRARRQTEAAALFAPASYNWAERLDGGRFEDLIHDLLLREPGVRRVRRSGGSNDRDGGRDLLVEWETSRMHPRRLSEGEPASVLRRVVVQCKAYAGNVGPSTLGSPGPVDVMYRFHAQGYLLAVSNGLTGSLVAYLDEMRVRGDYFVESWTRSEIEDRLSRNPDIAGCYADLLGARGGTGPP